MTRYFSSSSYVTVICITETSIIFYSSNGKLSNLDPLAPGQHRSGPTLDTVELIQGVVIRRTSYMQRGPRNSFLRNSILSCHQVSVFTATWRTRCTNVRSRKCCETSIVFFAVRFVTRSILIYVQNIFTSFIKVFVTMLMFLSYSWNGEQYSGFKKHSNGG